MMVVAVVMLYPFWVMIITSLKSEAQFLSGGGFSWLSWSGLTSVIPIGQELLSSTIVCSSSILIILCVGLPAGFAFSKLRFRMSTVVFLVIVSAMMVPLQAILMPEFVNVTRLASHWRLRRRGPRLRRARDAVLSLPLHDVLPRRAR